MNRRGHERKEKKEEERTGKNVRKEKKRTGHERKAQRLRTGE